MRSRSVMRSRRVTVSGHHLMVAATSRIGTATIGSRVRVAGVPAAIRARVNRTASLAGSRYPGASKVTRPGGGSNLGFTAIYAGELGAILARRGFILALQSRFLHMPVVLSSHFSGCGTSPQSTRSAIVTCPIHREVIHHGAVVHIGDMDPTEVVYRPIIKEFPTPPFTAGKTKSSVPEAIIDAAVKAHVWPPIAGVPQKRTASPPPVTRGP